MIGEETALIQTPRKRQRKWNGHRLLFFYKYFYFISLYTFVSLFVLNFTFLMQKIKKLVTGVPDGGAPCHGTIGTMGNPALVL